jgi:hypothetical protein
MNFLRSAFLVLLANLSASSAAEAQCLFGLAGARRVGTRVIADLNSTLRVRPSCTLVGRSGPQSVSPGPHDYLELVSEGGSGDAVPQVVELRDNRGRSEAVSIAPCVNLLLGHAVDVVDVPGIHGEVLVRPVGGTRTCSAVDTFIARSSEAHALGLVDRVPEGAVLLDARGARPPSGGFDVYVRRRGGRVAWLVERRPTGDRRTDMQATLAHDGGRAWPFLSISLEREGRLVVEFPADDPALLAEARTAAEAGHLRLRAVGHGPLPLNASAFTSRGFHLPISVLQAVMSARYGAAGAGLHPDASDVLTLASALDLGIVETYAGLANTPTMATRPAVGDDVGHVYARVGSAASLELGPPSEIRDARTGAASDGPFVRPEDVVVVSTPSALRSIDGAGIARCAELAPGQATAVGELVRGVGAHLIEILPGPCAGADLTDRIASRRVLLFHPDALLVTQGDSSASFAAGTVDATALRFQARLPPAAYAAFGRVPANGLTADLPINPVAEPQAPGAAALFVTFTREPGCDAARVAPADLQPEEAFHVHLIGRAGEHSRCLGGADFRMPRQPSRRWRLGESGAFELLPAALRIGTGFQIPDLVPLFTLTYPLMTFEGRAHLGVVDLTFGASVTASLVFALNDARATREFNVGVTAEAAIGGREGSATDRLFGLSCTVGRAVAAEYTVDGWCGAHVDIGAALESAIRHLTGANGRGAR